MESPQFNVVVDGSVLDGFETGTVQQQLQQQLKLPEAKAKLLLAGKTVTVKRDVDATLANVYCKKLRDLGVNAYLEPIPAPAHKSTIVEIASDDAVTTTPTAQPATQYFSSSSPSAESTKPSRAFKRAALRSGVTLGAAVLMYALVAVASVGLLLFYVVHEVSFLKVPPLLFSASVYLIVSLMLALLAILIWRPFLPQSHKTDVSVLLSPIQEPSLFAFITQLCEKLALKPPTEIALTTATTNSASLLPGFKHFKSGEYRLTLSLPALENGSLAQLAGMLAADLATCAHPLILRYHLLATWTQDRLGSCLGKRDWLAVTLEKLAQTSPGKFSHAFNLAEKIIELSNLGLQKLSAYTTSIGSNLQRSLPWEQDRYTALIGGSDHFIDTMIFRARLETATRDANAKNLEDRIEGGLVDDVPALIRHYYEGVEENFSRDMQRKWNAETTPRNDEPPIMRERIERIISTKRPASIVDDLPPASLLKQRDELARHVTLSSYTGSDLHFDPALLMPTDELTYAATQDILQQQQAAIYFNDWLRPFRFWILTDYNLVNDMPLQDAASQLSVCINEIRRLTPDRAKFLAEYELLQNQLREILLAQHVLAAGKKFAFRYLRYDGTTLAPILEERQQEIAAVAEKLVQQETVMGGRITLGLRLSGQAEREVRALHDAMRLLCDIGSRLDKLSLDCFQVEQLLRRQHQLREADYTQPIKRLETKIDDACNVLMARLQDIPYPLDGHHRTLKDFVEKALTQSHANQRSPTLQRAQRMIDAIHLFNEKLSRQAADYGTTAEEAYRIEAIRLIR